MIALFGATGQLGYDIQIAADTNHRVLTPLGHEAADITDQVAVARIIEQIKPDTVINSAAWSDVERAEDERDAVFAANAAGALNIAKASADVGARCIYISTDYVFDGSKPGGGYVETDATGPLNVYGQSKLAGEGHTLGASARNLVIRVSSLFGVTGARGKGGNFIETILKRARAGGPLRVVSDQWMTPTYTADVAPAILALAEKGVSGVVHASNTGACSWHTFAEAAVRGARLDVEVIPVPASTYPTKARRPVNSALDTGRLAGILGQPLRPWREALEAYLVAKGHVPA